MRMALGWILLVLGAACIVGGGIGLHGRQVVYDKPTFQALVLDALGPEAPRKALAQRIVDAILGESAEAPVARDLLSSALAGLLGSETARAGLEATAGLAWHVVAERPDEDVTLDATLLRDRVGRLVGDEFPELTARLEATPTPFVVPLFAQGDLPSVARWRGVTGWVAWVLLAAGLLLVACAVVLRRRGVAAAAGLLSAVAFGVTLALGTGGLLLTQGLPRVEGRVLVEATWSALTGRLALWAGLVSAAAFLVALFATARRPGTLSADGGSRS